MPVMSARLSDALIKATYARDIQEAFNRVFSEFLELKLSKLEQTIAGFQTKWGISFEEFKTQIKEGTLKEDSYSFDTENDFRQWEEAETLKAHYIKIKDQWM